LRWEFNPKATTDRHTVKLTKSNGALLRTGERLAVAFNSYDLAGGGLRINEILDSLGMKATRVNSRTPGREINRTEFGWGQTSPREMATLMEKISNGEIINKNASKKMLRLLGRNYWDEEAISQIPIDVFIASKSGAVDATRNEVLFVNGKHCRYIFCICTKNNQDKSWEPNNEAWELTRKLSKLLWDYYN